MRGNDNFGYQYHSRSAPGVWFFLLLAVLLLSISRTRDGFAHPLGNFSVNRYSRLELSIENLRIYYVVDMAEIPALQERAMIDTDRDGHISDQEHISYLGVKSETLRLGLALSIDGEPMPLKLLHRELTFPPGEGGLSTQRLTMTLKATLPLRMTGKPWQVEYQDNNYGDRLGWKEIIARPSIEVDLLESNVPDKDLSDELRRYPEKMLSSPIDLQSARLTFAPAMGISTPPRIDKSRPGILGRAEGKFTRLITTQNLTLRVVLITLVAAMGLGAVHALSPGHGKAIVGAYLVGSRATAKHAVFLGVTVTLTHTMSVFALGFVTLFASRYVLPEQLYPWLGTVSALIVVGIGATLLVKRVHSLSQGMRHSYHQNQRAHDHIDHSHSHDTDHDHHPRMPGSTQGGFHLHHHEPHDHVHESETGHHNDGQPHHGHSHLPPGANGAPVTWRSLLALGISGGILPCPSALVVLLGAISLNRIGFGLILIVAFSVGLAGVLTGIGLLFVRGREMAGRFSVTSPLMRFLPIVSAFVITILGVVITVTALRQALY